MFLCRANAGMPAVAGNVALHAAQHRYPLPLLTQGSASVLAMLLPHVIGLTVSEYYEMI